MSFDEVLVSIMGYHYPEKMIEELKRMGYTCDKTEEGVFLLSHDAFIPIQVVLINRIDEERYPWISAIRMEVSGSDVDRVLGLLDSVGYGVYAEKAKEVTDLIIRRLEETAQKEGVLKMNETRNLFREEFEEKDRDEELKSKDSMIERLKAEIVKLGGNVAAF